MSNTTQNTAEQIAACRLFADTAAEGCEGLDWVRVTGWLARKRIFQVKTYKELAE